MKPLLAVDTVTFGGHSGNGAGGLPRRCVQPEILDRLSPDSPAARASRRDLQCINRLMGTEAWFRRVLAVRRRPDERVLELGAGTGELGLALDSIAPDWAGLDLVSRPPAWPAGAQWFQADVLKFGAWPGFPVVIGNLFFHHFSGAELGKIGERLGRHTRVIVASEPLRARRTGRWFALICPLLRAHPVTRHDGRVSIAAGFRHDELPRLLGLDPQVWRWRLSETWQGASRMVAERKS